MCIRCSRIMTRKGWPGKSPEQPISLCRALLILWIQDVTLQPLPERPGISLPPQSLSVAGRRRVKGLPARPCLVSQLIAACHEALLPCLSTAAIALCSRFPRANAIHTGAMIVAYLLLTISRNPNARYWQHTEDGWWLKSISWELTSPQHLGLLDKIAPLWVISAFEQLSGIRLPGQSPGALLAYACIAVPGRYPDSQLGTGLQEKGLWNCLGSLLEKYNASCLVLLDKKCQACEEVILSLRFSKISGCEIPVCYPVSNLHQQEFGRTWAKSTDCICRQSYPRFLFSDYTEAMLWGSQL